MSRKIENLQALRGIAVLLVVFFHIMLLERKYGGADPLWPAWLGAGFSGVDLFFVISGCVIWTVTHGRIGSSGAIGEFLYHRLTRIYPAYWAYSLLVLAVFLFRPEFVNASTGHRINIPVSFLLLPQENPPLLLVGWTLIHEMYFYVAFALLMLAPERHLTRLLGVWAALVVVGNSLETHLTAGPLTSTLRLILHPLTIEFIAGCLVARAVAGGCRAHARTALAGGALLFVGGCAVYLLTDEPILVAGAVNGWPRVLLFGLPSALIVYGAVALESAGGALLPRALRLIGDASYSIYLSHVLVLSAIGRLWRPYATPERWDNALVTAGMLAATLGVGFLSYRWLERPLLATARRLQARWGIGSTATPATPPAAQ